MESKNTMARTAAAVLACALLMGCSDSYVPLQFASIVIDGGNNQTGKVCTKLPQPLVVLALDQFGDPLPGAMVRFSADEGTFDPESMMAASDGRVRVEYTLGSTPGPVQARATAWHDQYVVTFDFTAEPDPPTTVRRVSGHNQSAPAGTALANPLVAGVRDACGRDIPGVTITWSTTAGHLAEAETVTDENGESSNTLALPDQPGTVTVTAYAVDLNSSVTFTATATDPAEEEEEGE